MYSSTAMDRKYHWHALEKRDHYMSASASKLNFLHVEDAAELMIKASLNVSAQGILNGCSTLSESYQGIADLVFLLQ